MQGKSTEYVATELAKQICSAPLDELKQLYQRACISPRVFQILFNTFHGDAVQLSRIRQQASANNVHPDETENCTRIFAESVIFAELGTLHDDVLTLRTSSESPQEMNSVQNSEGEPEKEPEEDRAFQDGDGAGAGRERRSSTAGDTSARSIIRVNVTVDSTLDTEKLEKQLALLRRYGAI